MCIRDRVSDEAMKFVPRPDDAQPPDRIFKLSKNEIVNPILSEWVKSAGITKNITFHCARHTAATLNLSLGTPIAVVSKLLGHSKIATTQTVSYTHLTLFYKNTLFCVNRNRNSKITAKFGEK